MKGKNKTKVSNDEKSGVETFARAFKQKIYRISVKKMCCFLIIFFPQKAKRSNVKIHSTRQTLKRR